MKSSNISYRFFLLVLPFLFTGCYTQLQMADRYSDYYAWDGYEEGADQEGSYQAAEERYLEDQYALENAGIYYKDYETEEWYKENKAENMYWEGYEDGYGNGYEDGFDGGYDRATQKYASNSYFYGYTPWAYGSWNRNHQRRFNRHYIYGAGFATYFAFFNTNWRYDMYSMSGYWYYDHTGFLRYWYHPFGFAFYNSHGYYGYSGFYGNSHYNTLVIYNEYNRTQRYKRSAELYRKGPRNSGLVNRDYTRTRSNFSNERKSGTTVRNRANSSGSRVRSTGRSGSVGRSTGSVGRSGSSSGSSKGRSRGSGSDIKRSSSSNDNAGSSVGRTRSSSGTGSSVKRTRSSSDNSSSRSRGSGNLSSNENRPDINRSSASRIGSTYTIPVKRVDYDRRVNANRSSFFNSRTIFRSVKSSIPSFRESFKNRITKERRSSSSMRRAINRTSSTNKSVSRSSSSRSVTKSSSSQSRSRSSSKSSGSSKRSRGGN